MSRFKAGAAFLALVALTAGLFETKAVAGTSDRVFGVSSVAFGATNAHVIVPQVGNKVALVRTLLANSDLFTARVTFYTNGPPVVVQGVDSGKTNFMVASGTAAGGTNGFALADNIIVANGTMPNDQNVRARVAAVTTTNIQIFPLTAPAFSIDAGSAVLYRVGTNTVLTGVTNLTTSLQSAYIAVGQLGQPFLIGIDGTASCIINSVGGEFYAPDK